MGLRLQKDLSHEKLRAVHYKECAVHALDVVRAEKVRFVSEVLVQTKRYTAELKRNLAAYLRQERLRIASAIDILQCGGGFSSEAPCISDEALQTESAWEGASCLFRRTRPLLDSQFDDSGEQAGAESSRDPRAAVEDGTGDQLAGSASEYFSKEAARGRLCADCRTPDADWASVSHGTYLCTDCAGKHRGLGVHFSFVRSTTMDRWSWKQLRRMQLGGNDNFHAFMRNYPQLYGQLRGSAPAEKPALQARYGSRAAAFYRRRLDAVVDGRDFTTPAPSPSEGCLAADIAAEVEAQSAIDDGTDDACSEDGDAEGQVSLEQEWASLESVYQRYRSVVAQK